MSIILLLKGVFLYEWADDWKKSNATILTEKDFYSHLNLVEYHDLNVQSNLLLLVVVFNNFQNMSQNIWAWSCFFFSAPGLAQEAALKKTKLKLDLFTDVDMWTMVEKGIRRGTCHAIHRYTKALQIWYHRFTNRRKIIIKIKNHHI